MTGLDEQLRDLVSLLRESLEGQRRLEGEIRTMSEAHAELQRRVKQLEGNSARTSKQQESEHYTLTAPSGGDRQHDLLAVSTAPDTGKSSFHVAEVKVSGTRPVRDLVLDVLNDLDVPAYSRELVQLLKALFGRDVPPTRFGTLLVDEEKAYRRRLGDGASKTPARAAYICPALTYDRGEPVKRLLCSSTWPLSRRIVGPLTSRVQHLAMTERLCDLALRADEIVAANPDMLRYLAADHARDLVNVKVRRGDFSKMAEWRDVARQQLERIGPEDESTRMEAASRLDDRAEVFQLFGRPDVLINANEPGHETWSHSR